MASHSSSSTDDHDWHSPPASPSMTTATDEADTELDSTLKAPKATATDAIPHMNMNTDTDMAMIGADGIASARTAAVGSGEPLSDQDQNQGQSQSQGQDQKGKPMAQRGARPGSLEEQGLSNLNTTTRAVASATGSGKARERSPSPSSPRAARRQSGQHFYFTSPHTRVGSMSSVHSTGSSHSPSMTARRSGRTGRPISLASVISIAGHGHGHGHSHGPASPASASASPRSSAYFHHPHTMGQALPQTPTASVSGSRPVSLLSFASPFAATSSSSSAAAAHANAHWEPQVALQLRQQTNVPRPLRLQPSLLRRDMMLSPGMTTTTTTTKGSGDAYAPPLSPAAAAMAAAASASEEAAAYRAEQAASRMARRRQWQQHLSADDYAVQIDRLEGNEGAFEVVSCFLQRLARAENDALLPANFPRSKAEQTAQNERMATMRKETVEALLPLLAYGPAVPAAPAKKAAAKAAAKPKPMTKPAAKPVAAKPAASFSATTTTTTTPATPAPAMPSKAYAPRSDSAGLPPTPPQSPYRYDKRRESSMSGITETSLGGGSSISGSNGNTGNTDEGNTTMWKSVKRASALFGWASGGNNNNNNNNNASAARFASE